MEKFIKAAQIAWNPFSEIKSRLDENKLNLGAVAAPFVGIILACEYVEHESFKYVRDSMCFVNSDLCFKMSPLLTNNFANQFGITIGVLLPVLLVFLLPNLVFAPRTPSEVAGTMLIVSASIEFYGSALGSLINFVMGNAILSDPAALTDNAWAFLIPIPMILVIAIWFWLGALLKLLGLTKFSTAIVIASYIGGIGLYALCISHL